MVIITKKKKKAKWDFILFPSPQSPFRPGSTYPLKHNHDFHAEPIREFFTQSFFTWPRKKPIFTGNIFPVTETLFQTSGKFPSGGNWNGVTACRPCSTTRLWLGTAASQTHQLNHTQYSCHSANQANTVHTLNIF